MSLHPILGVQSESPNDSVLATGLSVCEGVSRDLLTIEVLVVVLLRPQAVLDDQAVRAREVRNSCSIQVATGNENVGDL